MSKDFPVDFVLIFALEKEIQAFLKYVGEYEKRESQGTWYKFKIANPELGLKYEVCAISLKEMGNYEATAATTRAIDVWNPKYVIIGGIAGGAKQEGFKLGDLVIAEDVIAYEPGKERNSGVDRRFRILRSSLELLQLAEALPSSQWATKIKVPRPEDPNAILVPKAHYGSVLSGEKVIAHDDWMDSIEEDLRSKLKSNVSRIAAVEMEGYGVGLAAYRADTAPGMLLAKAVCDWADSSKNDMWQSYAAHVSASFIFALVSSANFTPGTGDKLALRVEKREYHRRSKIGLCQRMGDDWEDLADWFDISPDRRRRFRAGRECQSIWDYLEDRQRLGALPDALEEIGRDDLVDELIPLTDCDVQ